MGYYKGILIEENLEEIKKLISDGTPLMEIARNFSIKYDTLIRHLNRLNVDYTTNQHRTGKPHYESRVSAMYYIENNVPISAPVLRKKLLEEGIKECICERCGSTEWMGEEIPLELHHIDGNHFNNRLENLMILCSNCHSQVHGYSKVKKIEKLQHVKKIKTDGKKTRNKGAKPKRYCVVCGKELTNDQKKFCSKECLRSYNGKRPPKEKLYELKDNGITNVRIAEMYGVTEAAVRQWFRKYNITTKSGE